MGSLRPVGQLPLTDGPAPLSTDTVGIYLDGGGEAQGSSTDFPTWPWMTVKGELSTFQQVLWGSLWSHPGGLLMDIQHPRTVSGKRMQGRPLELEAPGSSAVPPSPVFADVRNVGVLPAIPRTAVSLGTL